MTKQEFLAKGQGREGENANVNTLMEIKQDILQVNKNAFLEIILETTCKLELCDYEGELREIKEDIITYELTLILNEEEVFHEIDFPQYTLIEAIIEIVKNELED